MWLRIHLSSLCLWLAIPFLLDAQHHEIGDKAFEINEKGTVNIKVFEGAGHPLRIVTAEKEPLQGHNPDAYGDRPEGYWETIFDWLSEIDIIKDHGIGLR